jgi:hypothetical protein
MATPTTNHVATAARLAQAQSLHRKALAQLGKALTTYREAGPEANGVVGLLQRAHDVGTAVLAQLGTDLAKAKAEADVPAPKAEAKPSPAPKAEQAKPAAPVTKPAAPAVTLPDGWEGMPAAVLAGFFAAMGGVAPQGGLDRDGLVAAVRELSTKQATPAPVAKTAPPKTEPKPAAAAQSTPKAEPKPEAPKAEPKADPLAAYRAVKAELKALGLDTTGKLPELQARLADTKAKGATAAAVNTAKTSIPSDAELAKLDSKGLVALFRKLPVELQRELLAAAR